MARELANASRASVKASYRKPLARARAEGASGEGGSSSGGGAGADGDARRARDGDAARVSFVRRRDSAPVHPVREDGVDRGDDLDGSDSAEEGSGPTPSAPPAERTGGGSGRAASVADPMARAAPLPPWADARARRKFTLEPLLDDGTHARCHVLRKRGPFGVFPTYVLYLDGRDTTTTTLADAVPILMARKRKKAKCTHYVIGDDGAERALNEAHPSYVGKLKANFIGTRFELLDSGARPRAWGQPGHLGAESDSEDDAPPRRALANVRYAVNILGVAGPRSLEVELLDDAGETVIHELQSARPRWNPTHRAYVLDFNGRVTRPSVKNFQLVARTSSADAPATASAATSPPVVAQFGRVDDDLFTLDFAHPFSPLTAFAACLSAFESKFGRE